MPSVSWVIKLTKLCNLRCSYCYEWNELGDPRRMSLETYGRALTLAATTERYLRSRHVATKSHIVFHGGEPFLVGREHFAAIRNLSRELGPGMDYAIQTNLHALQDWQIAEVRNFPLGIGVSFDLYSGVRLTVAGAPSEDRVFANIMRLREAGIRVGIIAVLAAHNAAHVHDLLVAMDALGAPVRLLPVFAGPRERPTGFETSDEALIAALTEAAMLRLEGRIGVSVIPVDGYIRIAVAAMLGLRAPRLERGVNAGGVFVVERDGRVLLDYDPGQPPLGHVMEDDVSSPRFAETLIEKARAFENSRMAEICGGCPVEAFCDGYPAIVNGPAVDGPGCRFARKVVENLLAVMDTPEGRTRIAAGLNDVVASGTEGLVAPSSLLVA